ncbi:hypothetical protein SAMN04488054_12912 [Salibacterium qingdaonense]|uniref:Ferric iron reductase protein FhuF, involved in iron transport n=2 Tax=Salibacterium qingdaonense TaxID=266892 RepID=A0A1I4PMM8_9BACI|nr:hypothetical protein SAMN04488054_12912 [Salibacterium qingdaonense]
MPMEPFLLSERNETLHAHTLTDEAACRRYLEKVQQKMQAPSLLTAASQFSKRYAWFVVQAAFSPMTLEGRKPLVTLGESQLVTDWSAEKWSPVFEPGGTLEASREEDMLREVFARHLTPIWRTLHAVSRVPMPILWENTAIRVFSLYEKKLNAAEDAPAPEKLQRDLSSIVQEAPGGVFDTSFNPLRPFYTSNFENRRGADVRVRQTCCFVYETDGGRSCCKVCPKYHKL